MSKTNAILRFSFVFAIEHQGGERSPTNEYRYCTMMAEIRSRYR